MEVGSTIQSYRKARRLTQKELADKIGKSKSYLSEIETDRKNVSVKLLSRIAEAFGIKASTLIKRAEASQESPPTN